MGQHLCMSSRRRRRCCICGELFDADPRVGCRQRACGSGECQRQRRSETQAAWRGRNPDYFTDRRLRDRFRAAEKAAEWESSRHTGESGLQRARRPAPLRVPAVLRGVPWDLAQAELGVAASDFLALTACQVLRVAQDQRSAQVFEKG